jgi:hypothetical protein
MYSSATVEHAIVVVDVARTLAKVVQLRSYQTAGTIATKAEQSLATY